MIDKGEGGGEALQEEIFQQYLCRRGKYRNEEYRNDRGAANRRRQGKVHSAHRNGHQLRLDFGVGGGALIVLKFYRPQITLFT